MSLLRRLIGPLVLLLLAGLLPSTAASAAIPSAVGAPVPGDPATPWERQETEFGMSLKGEYMVELAKGPRARLDAYLDAVQRSGVTLVRIDIAFDTIADWHDCQALHWEYIDKVLRGITARGMRPSGIITSLSRCINGDKNSWRRGPSTDAERAAFRTFAVAAVEHLKQYDFIAYEIWNEPNLEQFWSQPSAEQYTRLLEAVVPALRERDPGRKILTGGTGSAWGYPSIWSDDFIEGIYGAHGEQWFDGVAVHPYTIDHQPDTADMARARHIREIMDNHGDSDKELWATEMGYSTAVRDLRGGGRDVVTEAQQEWLVRKTVDAWIAIPGAKGPLFWYTIADFSNNRADKEACFGLLHKDLTPKPAYKAFAWLAGGKLPGER